MRHHLSPQDTTKNSFKTNFIYSPIIKSLKPHIYLFSTVTDIQLQQQAWRELVLPCKLVQLSQACSSARSYWTYLSSSPEERGSLPDKPAEDKIIIFHTHVSHNLASREQVVCSQGNRAWCTALYHQATSIKSLSAWRQMLQVCHCSQVSWDLSKSTCHEVLTNSKGTILVLRHAERHKNLPDWSQLVDVKNVHGANIWNLQSVSCHRLWRAKVECHFQICMYYLPYAT